MWYVSPPLHALHLCQDQGNGVTRSHFIAILQSVRKAIEAPVAPCMA